MALITTGQFLESEVFPSRRCQVKIIHSLFSEISLQCCLTHERRGENLLAEKEILQHTGREKEGLRVEVLAVAVRPDESERAPRSGRVPAREAQRQSVPVKREEKRSITKKERKEENGRKQKGEKRREAKRR